MTLTIYASIFVALVIVIYFLAKKRRADIKIKSILKDVLFMSKANIVFILKSDVKPVKDIKFEIIHVKHRNPLKKIKRIFENIKMDSFSVGVLQKAEKDGAVCVRTEEYPDGEIKNSVLERETVFMEIHFLAISKNAFYSFFIETNDDNRFTDPIKRKAINHAVSILKEVVKDF